MLRCREVTRLVGSDEWRATPRRRVAVWMHLAMCRYCRAYTRSLQLLGRTARRLYRAERPDDAWAGPVMEAVRRAAAHRESPPTT